MQIVIELNDNEYAELNELKEDHPGALSWSAKRILDGTPLPKGHKVIDATVLQEHLALVPIEDRTFRETVEIIDWFPSI